MTLQQMFVSSKIKRIMINTSRFRYPVVALLAVTAASFSSFVFAAPQTKIIGVKSGAKLYAIVKAGSSTQNVEMLNAHAEKFLIGEEGNALVYESYGTTKGGFENSKAAVSRYQVGGKFSVLLDEPLLLDRIREYHSRKGRTAYVISMSADGSGIPYVFVCSPSGKVWEKRAARVAGTRKGKLIIKRYTDDDMAGDMEAKPIDTLYLDLETLLTGKK